MGGRRTSGFTLLELMLTLAVVGVIVALAIPNFREFILNSRLTGAANDLLASTQLARSEAIKRQRTVALCASPNPTAGVPTCDVAFRGWVVWVDTNNDGVIAPGEAVVGRHDTLDPTLRLLSNGGGLVSYQSSGFSQPTVAGVAATTHVLICDERGELPPVGNAYRSKRALFLSASGRPSVLRTQDDFLLLPGADGICP
jgi:type IV fimbrial biogenesis protein FimT